MRPVVDGRPLMSAIEDTNNLVTVIAYLTHRPSIFKMSSIAVSKAFETGVAVMKRNEHPLMTPERLDEARQLGEKLARLRMARRIRQADAATRAGLSRSTAVLLEKGDLSRTQAQILRYLEAIAPGVSLLSLLKEDDPSLQVLAARETTQRVRTLSKTELERLDF